MTLGIGYSNANREDVIEVADDTTEEELEEIWQEWSNNYIDGGPEIIDSPNKTLNPTGEKHIDAKKGEKSKWLGIEGKII